MLSCYYERQIDGRVVGRICKTARRFLTPAECRNCEPTKPPEKPTIIEEVWDRSKSIISFVADGCHTVTPEQYKERMTICNSYCHRAGKRCGSCGCYIAIKGKGRVWVCKEGKWPPL